VVMEKVVEDSCRDMAGEVKEMEEVVTCRHMKVEVVGTCMHMEEVVGVIVVEETYRHKVVVVMGMVEVDICSNKVGIFGHRKVEVIEVVEVRNCSNMEVI